MRQSFDADRIPGYRADERMEAVLRFRRMWGRYQRPDDVNQLLKQFPRVSIQDGLMLDYISLGGKLTTPPCRCCPTSGGSSCTTAPSTR